MIGAGLATLSQDQDYLSERQMKAATDKPKHAGLGMFAPRSTQLHVFGFGCE